MDPAPLARPPVPDPPSRSAPGCGGLLVVGAAEIDALRRAWDEQRLDLLAAARQLADVPTAGFGPEVEPAARAFAVAWEAGLGALGADAGSRAEAVRTVGAVLLGTDAEAGRGQARLRRLLGEVP